MEVTSLFIFSHLADGKCATLISGRFRRNAVDALHDPNLFLVRPIKRLNEK